jgi:tetratricopeptide (TPR) repeat protein
MNRGAALSRKGDLPAAIAAWQRAAILDPLKNDAFFNIGYVSLLRNDFDLATKSLNESLNLRGHDSEALFLLGRAYERQGRDESQKLIAQATRLSQRLERWLTQPMPRLERVSTTSSFMDGQRIWADRFRLERRAKSDGLAMWLESAQNQMDSYMYGEAIRELQIAIRVFPSALEARELLREVNRQRMIR